ncbi:MAG: hypothetical protein BHV68_02145 [Bacteroidales bacterium 43_8]|nr:MAG: hypothetical protein BHV68_02145 [Bacteroidales bacterium 43_8]
MIFLYFIGSINIQAQTDGVIKVSLEVQNVSLIKIIENLRVQTHYNFLFNSSELSGYAGITIKLQSVPLKQALDSLLIGNKTGLTYSMEGKTVIIKKSDQEKVKIYRLFGVVLDKEKQTMPGVTVKVDGMNLGTATNNEGKFTLELPQQNGSLVFSFVGFKTKKVPFIAGKELIVTLEEEISNLDEVTVIAYGERNKRELISSISSVKAEDLEEIPSASFENLLQGHMAGVEIHNVAGSPGGGGTRVNIRGYNSLLVTGMNDGSPLYVIDGVPMHSFTSPVTGTNTLAELDPSTIESVEVLKDAASAAIYGSRASNGVILITTKKGKAGKAKFSANVSYSSSILPETPTQISGHGERLWHIQMARNERAAYQDWNTYAYVMPKSYEEAYINNAVYDFFWNRGNPEGYSYFPALRQLQDSLNPFFNNSTNWWKYTFRTGEILNANIQASGGSENFKYLVGLGWYDEKGIMLGSDFKRVNFISNLNANLRKNLSLDARVYMAYTDRSKGEAYTGFGGGAKIEGFTVDPMSNSTLLPGAGSAVEEETLKRLNGSLEKNNSFNIRGSVVLNYEIIKGLTLSANLATDFTQSQKNAFDPSYLSFENLSVSTGEIAQNLMLQTEELLHYKFDVKKDNHFDILLGFTYSRWVVNSFSGSGEGSPSNDIHYVTDAFKPLYYDEWGGVRALQSYRSNSEKKILVSGFGRLAYNYKQKYLTEFTLRRDGSSVFGKDVRWANFPSLALGWTYSEENFLKNVWWLSYGKIRASWGRSGQQFANPYLALGILETGSNFMGNVGIRPNALTNSKLTWEETDQYDIGLDLDIFDYRVKLKMDYYYKYSKSLLFDVTLPGNVYFHNSQWQNVMEISNEGVELEALFDIFRDSEVKWRAKFNISRNWNRFEKSYTNMDMDNLVVGRSIFGIYAYKDEGFVQDEKDIPVYADQSGNKQGLYFMYDPSYPVRPGMRKIKDMNMDGMISDEDMYYAASALPIAYGGLVNEIKWKGFDVNLLLTYSLGRKMVNAYMEPSLAFNKKFGTIFSNYLKKTYWQKPGDVTDLPLLEAGSTNYTGQYAGGLDSQIETVNYLRIKQLTIGYNVPKAIVKKLNLDGIRVFFTGENLWLWSNYSGVDPEVVDPMTGVDNGVNYPLARKLTLGLSVNF